MSKNYELHNGDCLEILPTLDKSNVVFVSDPPFNVGYHYATYKDNKPEGEYYEWLAEIFGNYPKVIIHYHESLYKFAFQIGEFPEKIVSWVYNANTPRQHRGIAFFGVTPDFSKVGQPYKNPTDKRIAKRISEGKSARLYDWWQVQQIKNVSQEKTDHPAQMPLEIMKRIIGILPNDITIIDPFMGSGSTGVACAQVGRKFIGIELDKDYFSIAQSRIGQCLTTHALDQPLAEGMQAQLFNKNHFAKVSQVGTAGK